MFFDEKHAVRNGYALAGRRCGTYGRRNGFTVNTFKCVQKRAKIVEVRNIVKYVNLDTNMLIPHSLVIPCSKLFPVVVQEVSGKWLEFRPRATAIPAPTMIQHKDGQMRENLIHELFTASQLQLWDDYYSFPHLSKRVHARTMMEACMEEGCIQQDLSGSSSYSLTSFRQSQEDEAREVLDSFIELE